MSNNRDRSKLYHDTMGLMRSVCDVANLKTPAAGNPKSLDTRIVL